MSTTLRYIFMALLVTLLTSGKSVVWAHHATAAQYDISRMVTLTGVISKLDWANPHVHAFVDVKRADGVLESWDAELASPGGIIVAGLSKETLKPGATLTLKGYPGNRADRTICVTRVKMPDGMTATFTVGI